MEEWAKQADQYEAIRNDGLWNKTLQVAAIMNQNHPFSAVRVKEILKWGKSSQYSRSSFGRKIRQGMLELQTTDSGWLDLLQTLWK